MKTVNVINQLEDRVKNLESESRKNQLQTTEKLDLLIREQQSKRLWSLVEKGLVILAQWLTANLSHS